jgi:hypothetical protein
MRKRISKKPQKSEDSNEIAFRVLQQATAEAETKSPNEEIDRLLSSRVMAEMGRRGGKIGGKRRLETMSPAQRKSAASKARWGEKKI